MKVLKTGILIRWRMVSMRAVLKRANYTWSLSALTFPHQLVRLILAEQVYRACALSATKNTTPDNKMQKKVTPYLTTQREKV